MLTKHCLKILLITLLSQAFFSCRWFTSVHSTYFAFTNFKVPEGTPTFQQGYKDGCSTVLYARGNDFYRTRYSYRYDPTLIGNAEYRFGHSRGYTWCFQNIVTAATGHGPVDAFLFPQGAASLTGGLDYTPGNLKDVGMFGGSISEPIAGGATLNDMMMVWQKGNNNAGVGGAGYTVFGNNPLWAGGSSGWWLGWD